MTKIDRAATTKGKCSHKRCYSNAQYMTPKPRCTRHWLDWRLSRFSPRDRRPAIRYFFRDKRSQAYLAIFDALRTVEQETGKLITVKLPAQLFGFGTSPAPPEQASELEQPPPA